MTRRARDLPTNCALMQKLCKRMRRLELPTPRIARLIATTPPPHTTRCLPTPSKSTHPRGPEGRNALAVSRIRHATTRRRPAQALPCAAAPPPDPCPLQPPAFHLNYDLPSTFHHMVMADGFVQAPSFMSSAVSLLRTANTFGFCRV